MRLISHRGNVNGKNLDRENHPDYLLEAIKQGFEVELDVWRESGYTYLGHDGPQYRVDQEFLERPEFWCHAKNLSALEFLSNTNCNYFWHQTDDYTLTSKGFIWTFPGKQLGVNSIAVLPENYPNWDLSLAVGICSDRIGDYGKSTR